MAEFKTAEQYVVDRLESAESELELLKKVHKSEIAHHIEEFESLRSELNDAYELLDMLRDFISVGNTSYFGNFIAMDNIYSREYPEVVARIMEYYDLKPMEENEDA